MSDTRRRRTSNGTKPRHGVNGSDLGLGNDSPSTSNRNNSKPTFSSPGTGKNFKPIDRERNNSGKTTGPPPRGKSSNSKAVYTRSQSYDKVRRIVSEEGRQARNLVTWNVPVDDSNDSDTEGGKPQVRRKPKSRSRNSSQSLSTSPGLCKKNVQSPRVSPRDQPQQQQQEVTSMEPPRKTPAKKIDLRARYWAFLFDNLQRAVDEIYQTCDGDESIVECKEVIMILKRATHDFESLIKRINVQKDFEQCNIENRPNSLAWEIRKMSPGRGLGNSPTAGERPDSPSSTNRCLNYTGKDAVKVGESTIPVAGLLGVASWADRVKGHVTKGVAPVPVVKLTDNKQGEEKGAVKGTEMDASKTNQEGSKQQLTEDDGEGWETVHRSKPNRSRPTSAKGRSAVVRRSQASAPATAKNTTAKNPTAKNPTTNTTMTDTIMTDTIMTNNTANNMASKIANNTANHTANNSITSSTMTNTTTTNTTKNTTNDPIRTQMDSNKALPVITAEGLARGTSRNRTDSEKENRPLNGDVEDKQNGSGCEDGEEPDQMDKGPQTDGSEKIGDGSEKIGNGSEKIGNGSEKIGNGSEKIGDVSEKIGDVSASSPIFQDNMNVQDLDPAILAYSTDKKLQLSSGDELDDNKDNNSDDDLATKLEEDVAVALHEEENLSNEIEKCQEEALASAIAEEEKLTKEIEEEESKEILVETDEGESDLALSTNTLSSLDSSQRTLDWNDLVADYQDRYRQQSPLSWGEMVEINEIEGRPPGYALHMHEKLSSPSRKRTREDTAKRHEERQANAQKKRVLLLEEKADKLKMLNEKIGEVREWKGELLMLKKKEMELKQQRAEQKRREQLEAVRRKAQEEEQKANEIAFINSLEAQNKKHDILARHMGHEARLHDLLEERQRKNVEKAAKEEAVQERKKALEEERLTRLKEMQKHRRDQEDKLNVVREQRERMRESAAKEKAKEREQRLSALNAAQQAKEEEIQKKIQQKHDETTRRHIQQIEQKREKAIELSMLRHYRTTDVAPLHNPYTKKKLCSLCSVMIPSEVYLLSHLRGKAHKQAVLDKHRGTSMTDEDMESYSLKNLVDVSPDRQDPGELAEKERQKGCRKRARKLRQRMAAKGKEYENNLPSKTQGNESLLRAKLQKLIKDLNKYLQSQGSSGPWEQSKVSAMDRALGELNRILAKKEQADQITFRACGGLSTLSRILLLVDSGTTQSSNIIPAKSVCSAANAFRLACKSCFENCQYVLYSGKLAPLVELLGFVSPVSLHQDPPTDQPRSAAPDPIAICLMHLLSTVLLCLVKYRPQCPSSDSRSSGAQKKQMDTFVLCGQDLISYLVCSGVIDNLTSYFNCVRGTVDENPSLAEFLQHSLGLLGAMTKFVSTASSSRSSGIFTAKREDPTQLLATFRATGFSGIVSLLYGILLHGGNPPRGSTATPPELPEHTLNVVTAGIKMLGSIGVLDLTMMQSALGSEGISLEFRHIATYLIWYCSHFVSCEDLLHEIILIVGYFTILNTENQVLVQSGNTPTLLQQLCGLPFQYFSDPRLMSVLFPSLMASCYNNAENKAILEQEMSCSLLTCFLEGKIQDRKNATPPSASPPKLREKEKDLQGRTCFELRFPESSWEDAVRFFGGNS